MIQDKAMLANLTVRAWSARKRDRDVNEEVEKAHAATDAGNFNKLLIDKVHLKPLVTLSSTLRDAHYAMTLPWGDNGDRLLPSAMYMDYTKRMRDLRSQFEAVVTNFIDAYPAYQQDARKRLGTLYDAADYPDASRLHAKFEARVSFMPVPDAKDFRVDLSADEVDVIRDDIEKEVARRQQGAIDDLWMRLKECVQRIHDRLSDPSAVFRDSLVENAQAISSIASKLNVVGDYAMGVVISNIEMRLCAIPPQRLRDDPALRRHVAEAAGEVLKLFP